MIQGDVDEVLDVYFRQCSILVTARDLAVMAATLANRGVNPVTGEQVISPYAVARTLSVMTSSGMYDYAGEWIYRVGIPAKSGVGGGIVAALPSQLGLGTFSPLLDSHGNSVRGLKVCETLSSHFDLHVLNRNRRRAHLHHRRLRRRAASPRGATASRTNSKSSTNATSDVRVIELVGALTFATVDYISRRLADVLPHAQFIVLDFRRVPTITKAAATAVGRCAARADGGQRHRRSVRHRPDRRRSGTWSARGSRTLPRVRSFSCSTRRSSGRRPDHLSLRRLRQSSQRDRPRGTGAA